MATAAGFDRHMAVNLRAPLLLSQALARQLPDQETGLIVNVLDQKLFNLNPDFLSYTLSKIGLQGLRACWRNPLRRACAWSALRPASPCAAGSQTDVRFAEQHRQNPLGVGVTQKISCEPCGLSWRRRAILRCADRRQRRAPDRRPRDIAFHKKK